MIGNTDQRVLSVGNLYNIHANPKMIRCYNHTQIFSLYLTNFCQFSIFLQNFIVPEPDPIIGDGEREHMVMEGLALWVVVGGAESLSNNAKRQK